MLFVSFWNLSLSNLPQGSFTNSVISADEAAARIASARSEARLHCVSADDLAAPHMRRAYENHVMMCTALAGLDVMLSVEDFFGPNFCNPLDLATVAAGKSLIVINCNYTYDFMPDPSARKGQHFRRAVALDSITFNLLQMAEDRDAEVESQIEATAASARRASASRPTLYAPLARTTHLPKGGTPLRCERLRADDMVSIEEAAAIAGTSCETIEGWIAKGRAIGVPDAECDVRLPKWQFEPALWSTLDRISEALGVNEGWAILCFLESAHGSLNGRTPRAAIDQGEALRVIEIAKGDF